jgi:predicted Rossmann-fold nucleotide-binding protein
MMVWQLLQAKHLPPTPFILYGSHWRGLCRWLEEQAMEQGYMDAHDLRLPTLVDTVDEAVNLIFDTLKEFQIQRDQNPDPP